MKATAQPAIWICGLPASGKSTLGRCLADLLGYPFLDTDVYLASSFGDSCVSQTWSRLGPTQFRRHEGELLRQCHQSLECVISVGGGCFLELETRALLLQVQRLVTLECPVPELTRRLRAQGPLRPWVSEATLDVQLSERAAMFAPLRDAAILHLNSGWGLPMALAVRVRDHLALEPKKK